MKRTIRWLKAPVDDYLAALESVAPGAGWRGLALGLAAAALSWWIYVPIHELLHALGCIAGGGEVTRLEIDAVYGAALLQKVFPFVAVGSQYAGQLTGFDTGGSDLTYLMTDALPFALTVALGVPALRAVPRLRNPLAGAALLGAAIPAAFAPFISLSGDYYEMGSILVSRIAAPALHVPLERWRSDDLFLLVQTLRGAGAVDWLGIGAAFCVGALLAWATYGAGRVVANAWLGAQRSR